MKLLVQQPLLADSSFYILAAREGIDPFARFTEDYPSHELLTCGMVMLEVLPGVHGPRILEHTRREFQRRFCVPMLASTWELAEKISRELRRVGRLINTPDIVIAACALEAGAAVLTLDKDFLQIKGLSVALGERDRA